MSSDLHNYGIIGFTSDNVGIDRRIYTGLTSTDPVLNVSYNGGRVDVYLNGIKLVGDHSEMPSGTRDYTFTQTGQGSSIQLRTGVALVSADVVECIGHVSGSGKTVSTYTPSVSAGNNTFNSSTTGMNGFTLQGSDLLNVYLNGVLLDSSDYTSDASADSVTITSLASGDIVHIQVIGALDYANFVPAGGGAFTGPITGVDVNGTELVLDADGDTSITADTDDRIDIKIGGTDIGNFNSDTLKLTKDNTPKLIVEDTNSSDLTVSNSTFWVTAPELQLNHNTSDANADGVIGNIKFQGTTKNNLGVTTANNTISQIEGRSFEGSAQVGQRVTDMKSGFRFKGYDGAGNYGDTLILKGKNLELQSGGGISFENHSVSSATGASSTTSDNVLDDYEEGTWTPTWDVATGSITAHSNTSGFYRKIGNVVYIWGYISWGGDSGENNSDALRVGGLPYQSISSGFGQASNQAGGVHMFAETLWSSDAPQGGRISNNSTIIRLTHSRTATGTSNVQVGDMSKSQNHSQTVFYGQYLT